MFSLVLSSATDNIMCIGVDAAKIVAVMTNTVSLARPREKVFGVRVCLQMNTYWGETIDKSYAYVIMSFVFFDYISVDIIVI